MVHFYRDILGFSTAWEGGNFAEFETSNGRTTLFMYSRKEFVKAIGQEYMHPKASIRPLKLPCGCLSLTMWIENMSVSQNYIAGATVSELLKEGRMDSIWLEQVRAMCRLLYPAGLNIDYYPTNFVPCKGELYYIDYECNSYMEKWDFEHWGVQYWTEQK